MKSKLINALLFTVGAAVGSAVTWKIVRDRYERIVQEEIESIKEAFSSQTSADQDNSEEASDDEEDEKECPGQIKWEELEDLEDEDDDETNSLMHRYSRLVDNYNGTEGGAEKVVTQPYVISPYDFGEIDGYSLIELTYYADGTLEDEDYQIVDDVDELIGKDSLYTFGEYEDDSVFVRNEVLRADFQILKDYRTYEEARGVSPDRLNDE